MRARKRAEILQGDCKKVLGAFADCYFDSIVTDAPYGIAFMNKRWDSFKNRDHFVAWMESKAREFLRVLKPGGYFLCFAGTRTYHWSAYAIESAGFEICDQLDWLYGQGFPKSLNISKAIQKREGVKPLGKKKASLGMANNPQWNALHSQLVMPEAEGVAARWKGWGTALKPAHEGIVLAQKPLSEKTIAGNVLKHGTGGINIDGCMIGSDGGGTSCNRRDEKGRCRGHGNKTLGKTFHAPLVPENASGRWPSNVILGHSPECVLVGTRKVKTGTAVQRNRDTTKKSSWLGTRAPLKASDVSYGNGGLEEIPKYECVEHCPIRILDEQSGLSEGKATRVGRVGGHKGPVNLCHSPNAWDHIGTWPGDPGGGASRFFYCPKPSREEKERGCSGLPLKSGAEITGRKEGSIGITEGDKYAGTTAALRRNTHPTGKPVALMEYLCRLITPPGGMILDPFCGSGTTVVAAIREGFCAVGIEKEKQYAKIAEARMSHAMKMGRKPKGFFDA